MNKHVLEAKYIINPATGFNFCRHIRFSLMTEAHSHHDFAEIFLVVKGSTGHNLNGVDGLLTENMLFFIKPQDVHYYFRSGKKARGSDVELLNLAFPCRIMEQALEYLGMPGLNHRLMQSARPVWVELPPDRKSTISQDLLEAGLAASTDPQLAGCKFRQALIELLSCFNVPDKEQDSNDNPKWLKDLCSEFESKTNFKGGLDFLIRKSGYSHEHLCRVFKACLGITPTDYVNRLKLKYAASLLAISDERIAVISLDAGFENLSHFNHLFKSRYGVSPARYRKSGSLI